jgi:hypothetical protein
MSVALIIAGLVMLGISSFLLKFGLAKNGQVRPFLATEVAQISYMFAIMISFTIGIFLILRTLG